MTDPEEDLVDDLVDDLDAVVGLACHRLAAATDRDWRVLATGLTWTCRATLEHVADDLFSYAGQIAVRRPELTEFVPFHYWGEAGDADETAIHVDPEADNLGVVRVVDACRGMLAAVARIAAPDVRGYHPYGVSDPGGFAAMGTTEVILHVHDVAGPLGFAWEPEPDVVRRVLHRLFPDVSKDDGPWPTLLWATGRGDLPGREPITEWRWDSTVRE